MIQNKDLTHPNTSLELHNVALDAGKELSKAEVKQRKAENRIKSWAKKVKGVDAYPNYNKQGVVFYESLKEAMEVLENFLGESKPKNSEAKRIYNDITNNQAGLSKADKKKGYKQMPFITPEEASNIADTSAAQNQQLKKAREEAASKAEQAYKESQQANGEETQGEQLGFKFESLKEAMKILEDIETAIKKKYGVDKHDATEDGVYYPGATDLYNKVAVAKSKLDNKGQGTSHIETNNTKGQQKVEDKLHKNVMNRSVQIDNILKYVPLRNAVQKSKDRHAMKQIKDSVYSINKNESLKEAIELMEALLNEASPFAVKRRIADEFKDKMDDKFSNAYGEVKKALQKLNDTDREVRKEGGETVVFTGDKITDFSKNPKVKKKQEEFNQATDNLHRASAKCDKVHHLRNLVRAYQTPEMADD